MKRLAVILMAAGALSIAAAPAAVAGEVTVHDPVHNCDYTVGWNVDARNPLATNAYTYGTCTG